MSELVIRTVERNGVHWTPIVEEIKRREAKGNRFIVCLPDKTNYKQYLDWLGEEESLTILQRDARAEGQAALTYAIGGDDAWQERLVVDPESGKEQTQYFYDLSQVDFDRLYDVLQKRSLRGGETKASLVAEQEVLTAELRKLTFELAKDPATVGARMLELGVKLQELDGAIEARSKTRKKAA